MRSASPPPVAQDGQPRLPVSPGRQSTEKNESVGKMTTQITLCVDAFDADGHFIDGLTETRETLAQILGAMSRAILDRPKGTASILVNIDEYRVNPDAVDHTTALKHVRQLAHFRQKI